MPRRERDRPDGGRRVKRWQAHPGLAQRDERRAVWCLVPVFELAREKSAAGIVDAEKDEHTRAFAVSKLAPHQRATLIDRDFRLVLDEQQS